MTKPLPLLSRPGPLLTCLAISACTTIDVPDFIVQHTLSSLTSEQPFTWEDSPGRSFVIRPLGTFRHDDHYCRDYQIALEGVRGTPVRRTACRLNDRWAHVDPSEWDM